MNTSKDDKMAEYAAAASKKFQELHQKITKMQVVGESGGGVVKITTNGKHYVSQVSIQDDTFKKEEKFVIEALIAAAINDATDKLQKIVNAKITEVTGIELPQQD